MMEGLVGCLLRLVLRLVIPAPPVVLLDLQHLLPHLLGLPVLPPRRLLGPSVVAPALPGLLAMLGPCVLLGYPSAKL